MNKIGIYITKNRCSVVLTESSSTEEKKSVLRYKKRNRGKGNDKG